MAIELSVLELLAEARCSNWKVQSVAGLRWMEIIISEIFH